MFHYVPNELIQIFYDKFLLEFQLSLKEEYIPIFFSDFQVVFTSIFFASDSKNIRINTNA